MKRIAIVGGETHIREVTDLAGSRLDIAAVCVQPEQRDWARAQFGVAVYSDLDQMLAAEACDIVAVANENDRKADAIRRCLSVGKHVIVDKPMALTLADTDDIAAMATRSGLRLLMLLTLRGNPWYRRLREAVQSGVIGEPALVYGRMSVELMREKRPAWFLDRHRSGGPILDLAIHAIDQAEWVAGRWLTSVAASEANLSDPAREELFDSGSMHFRLDNGGACLIEHDRLMPPGSGSDYRLSVVGTTGRAELRLGQEVVVVTAAGEQHFDGAELGPTESVVSNWLDSLECGVEPLVPDWASYRANRIACIARQAAAGGGVLPIEPPSVF